MVGTVTVPRMVLRMQGSGEGPSLIGVEVNVEVNSRPE